ncbi:class I SAM-dependent methyltransferase [Sphingobium yanoikuyae]|uniref:class I SAM-dependent methyltransferase n=1 Tax=Sphingobium yanoikuyae TaxID=13690 RepID=UPI0035ADABD7
MPYNLNIPGQVNELQLQAIEVVASLVPDNGCVVEVGSLFGLTSWAWAKSVPQSAKVYCIDPWEANAGIRNMEKAFGITYGIEQFKKHLSDCDNVVPIQAYSPQGVADWDIPVDLYYEDAVHTDPILSANVDFWTAKLKPTGVVCGDDYRPRFRDVRRAAEKYAANVGRKLHTVGFFWCVLPDPELVPDAARVARVLEELGERSDEQDRLSFGGALPKIGPLVPIPGEVKAGNVETYRFRIENSGLTPWTGGDGSQDINLVKRIFRDGFIVEEEIVPTGVPSLNYDLSYDIPISFNFEFEPGEHNIIEVGFDKDLIGAPKPYRQKMKISGSPSARAATKYLSREYFLRYSRQGASLGFTQKSATSFELDRPGMKSKIVGTSLGPHAIGLLYNLARDAWSGGAIVDIGAQEGASTWALCRGLSDRDKSADRPIVYTFDDWRDDLPSGEMGNWFRTIAPYADLCTPKNGKIVDLTWPALEVSILSVAGPIDMDAHSNVVSELFPNMKAGSVFVVNNYICSRSFWMHMEMIRLKEYFGLCQFLRNETAFYECLKTPMTSAFDTPVHALPYEEQVRLLDEACSAAPESIRQVLICAAANHATAFSDYERARQLLNLVRTDVLTDNPLIEVSKLASDSLREGVEFLAQAKGAQ